MLSFFECGRMGDEPAAGFMRLKAERIKKKRKPYLAYRDYRSDRRNETHYCVINKAGDTLAGPTPLLTCLVLDYVPGSGERIVRLGPNDQKVPIYKSTTNGWKAIKCKT